MSQQKKGLGRGLSALIPNDEMDLLSSIARGELTLLGEASRTTNVPAPEISATLEAEAGEKEKNTPSKSRKFPSAQKALNSKLDSAVTVSSEDENASINENSAIIEAVDKGKVVVEWLVPTQIAANPYQPRRTFDPSELEDLTASVREHGILQPIIVRPWPSEATSNATTSQAASANPPFQLIAGERRWRAAQAAGLERVPVVIRQVSDQQALELAVIENVQRHDISPLDAALAYRRLADEFGLSQEKIAQRVGKSRSSVANTQRLLELPTEAQNALQDGTLSEGHGRAILLAPGDGARRAAFRTILRDRLSVREAEELSRRIAREANADATSQSAAAKQAANENGDAQHIVQAIQQKTGCRVQFRPRRRGGHFVIHCATPAQMEQIAALLGD